MARRRKGASAAVTLRTDGGDSVVVEGDDRLDAPAMRWSAIVQKRMRWVGGQVASHELAADAAKEATALFGADGLRALARAGFVEVSVPFRAEEKGWAARIMPWEYLLSAATAEHRGERPLAIVRHLDRAGAPAHAGSPSRAVAARGAPAPLAAEIAGIDAAGLLRAKLELPVSELVDPTLEDLESALGAGGAPVVHLVGVDTRTARAHLELDEARRHDGVVVRGDDGAPRAVGAERLAKLLGASAPALVAFDLGHSAARTAALAVAHGAAAAIGFQDTFDRDLAALFFADFYRAWRATDWDVHVAFVAALRGLRRHGRPLRGSGLVLWSTRPLLDGARSAEHLRAAVSGAMQRPGAELLRAGADTRDALGVHVAPRAQINYALLHNGEPLLHALRLTKWSDARAQDVDVEVRLDTTETREAPYRSSLILSEELTDVAARVVVPLTWMLDGALTEAVRTSLSVRVRWGGETLYSDTHRVTLLPPDEWVDDDDSRQWLPSFIYPRDPAVSRVLRAAQPHLVSLADDVTAGFDGYQSIDEELDDPTEGVDLQVRAIWSALIQDLPLSYVNPPPTYTELSQRLRMPSDILDEGRGTCIDLTLLLCACLEYVEIYPVVFLLQGHAFPGYWRSEAAWDDFTRAADGAGVGPAGRQRFPWLLEGREGFREVVEHVHADNLVPLESVWLTRRAGFWEAVEEGWENLRVASEFHSMLDVTLARQRGVTPLPMRRRPA